MLNISQVQTVRSALSDIGLINRIDDELLDHCCSIIEQEIRTGISFDSALKNLMKRDFIDSLRKMNKQLRFIHFSKFLYMKITILGLLIISIISIYNLKDSERETLEKNNEDLLEVPFLAEKINRFDPPEKWPLSKPGKVSSGFGMRMHPVDNERKFHHGIDIPAALGTPVLATASGTVKEAGFTKNYGNYIILQHDEIYMSRYSQLSEISVKEGDSILKGDPIGKVGSSGRSTAPHLHFEVLESGKPVDPMKFIKA